MHHPISQNSLSPQQEVRREIQTIKKKEWKREGSRTERAQMKTSTAPDRAQL